VDKDAAWNSLSAAARDTLIALYPIKKSFVDKGGKAWIAPCRALVSANISPPPSPQGKGKKRSAWEDQIPKGDREPEESDESPGGEESEQDASPQPKPKAKAPKVKGAKAPNPPGQEDGGASAKPYLSSKALLAVLPPQRRAQLYLAESWTTKTRSEREKHLERILRKSEYGGRFEDPEMPAWRLCVGASASRSAAGQALHLATPR
jgi:hypothetical protein